MNRYVHRHFRSLAAWVTLAMLCASLTTVWPASDAAAMPGAKIGDTVFFDADGDGIQGGLDTPLSGVQVELRLDNAGAPGALAQIDSSSTSGSYGFNNVPAGTYHVVFIDPAGNVPTLQDQGLDDTIDSDADASGVVGPITVVAGQVEDTIDAGFTPPPPSSISDFVWQDDNGDGIQDLGEPGLAGVPLRLFDDVGGAPNAVVGSTVTDANGNYSFPGLAAGAYHLQIGPPAGYSITGLDLGGDDTLDSDVDPATGYAGPIVLAAGVNDDTIDAGLVPAPVSLADFVWNDLNQDGIQDAGEPGLAGVTVELWSDNAGAPDTSLLTVVSDTNGNYLFASVPAGTYHVSVTPPAGYALTALDQGADDTLDSDVDPATGFAGPIVLAPGTTDDTIDAGLIALPGSLADFVWQDDNGDGIQDAGEPGLAGETVELWTDSAGMPAFQIATTATDANGLYSFPSVPAGTYHVKFATPTGFAPSPLDAGADDTLDSDADPGTGYAGPIVLSPGVTDTTVDAGFVPPPATLGDLVFDDLNADGIQDAAELGLAGVTVELWSDSAGAPNASIASTVTDANGNYSFPGLAAGTYHVTVLAPTGTMLTLVDQGADDTLDSDIDPATGFAGPITIASGVVDDTIDAGIVPLPNPSIADRVWDDLDANGLQDLGEPGLSGVSIALWADAGGTPGAFLAVTTTDAAGLYEFDNLNPGSYHVSVVAPSGYQFTIADAGADDTLDSDADQMSGFAGPITVVLGDQLTDIDIGLTTTPGATISDFVWNDLDGNGIQDTGEPGLAAVNVLLLNDNAGSPGSIVGITSTDANGNYSFSGVAAGSYFVRFLPTTSLDFTRPDAGADDSLDSDVDPATGIAGPILVTGVVSIDNVDAGLGTYGSIGDLVFEDLNIDGIQDAGEPGFAGATVTLWSDSAGSPGSVLDTMVSDATGNYLFEFLPAGDYHIAVVLPAGMNLSPADQGGDDTLDSDVDPATGFTALITLAAGADDDTIDAGLEPFAPSGDVNCDGLTNIVDALIISQFTVGLRTGSGCPLPNLATNLYIPAGDVNNDGMTNIADSLIIQQCEVGINNVLCP